MRTTIAIDDHLLSSAKRRAQQCGLTLGQLVEQALRGELARDETYTEGPPVPVFEGVGGFRPGVDVTSTRSLLEALDEGQPLEAAEVNLLDVNIVLAAHRADHTHHDIVRRWFDALLESRRPFSVPDIVWVGFVRIATNRRIFTVPTPVEHAFAFLSAVRAQPGYTSVTPGPLHMALFERACREADAAGDLTVDAYLAALAVEHDCTLVSFDRDFARFPGLRWIPPAPYTRTRRLKFRSPIVQKNTAKPISTG